MSEKKEEFKINESENGTLTSTHLSIDGASYIDGMPDYEWYFSIGAEHYKDLFKALSKQEDFAGDAEEELVKYLKENGTKVSQLTSICRSKKIPYYFTNYM